MSCIWIERKQTFCEIIARRLMAKKGGEDEQGTVGVRGEGEIDDNGWGG